MITECEQSSKRVKHHLAARPSAAPNPIPELAPVTIQFFPSNRPSISSGLNFFEFDLRL